jgi:hypothetical protein
VVLAILGEFFVPLRFPRFHFLNFPINGPAQVLEYFGEEQHYFWTASHGHIIQEEQRVNELSTSIPESAQDHTRD